MNLRMLLALKRLDQDPLDDEGEVKGGALGGPAPGDGVVRVHMGDRGLCRIPIPIGTPVTLFRL